MKPGVRAVGVAESFVQDRSTLAAAVVRADRVVDGFAFTTCTVGGTDATDRITTLVESLNREDLRYVMVAGIAPAWFNIVDLHALHDRLALPVVSVTFEESNGLSDAINTHFSGENLETRLRAFQRQPDRRRVDVGDSIVYARAVGLPDTEATTVVRGFTPEGGRPEPLRVARLAARAADHWRRETESPDPP